MKRIALALCLTLMIGGCASTGMTDETIQLAATAGTGIFLSQGIKDPVKRTNVANQMYSFSNALYTAATGQVFTADQLKKYMLAWKWTGDADQITSYVNDVVALYSGYLKQINGDPAKAIAVLTDLAKGVQAGATAYATVTASTAQ